MGRVNKLSRTLALFTLISVILSSWPAVKAVQGQSLTPAQVAGSPVAHRYVIFLPTICPTSPAVAPSAFGCPASLTRINAAQRGQSAGMFGPLLQAMRRAGIAFTPYFYSYPDASNYQRPSPSNKADWYLAQDTNGYLVDSARRLDRQVREILQLSRSPNYQPHAAIDLIGHGLGGLVAAFWVVNIATPAELSHVHGLIAFDTPLQGFSTALAHEERPFWTGKIGSDLLQRAPGRAVASINNPRAGLLRKLPRVLTIAGTGDAVVGAQLAWIGAPAAPWNLQAAGCARGDVVCHLAILSNHGALACAAGWLNEGSPRDALPFALACPLTHHAARTLPLIVPRTTKVLPAAVTQQIVVPRGAVLNAAASSLPLIFHTANATVRQLQPGDVITSGPTPSAPYGLLRKVTAVQSTGSQTVVQTAPATLEDAVSQMDVTVHGTVGADAGAFQPAIPGVTAEAIPASQAALARPLGAAAPLGRDPLTVQVCEELHVPASKLNHKLPDSVTLKVQFCVGGTFNLTINMPLDQPIQTAFTADLQDSAKIELKGDLNLSLGSTGDQGIVLGRIPLAIFPLVPPAIYVVPELQIVVHADGSISASVDVGASASIDIIAGVSCLNSQCQASDSTPPPSLQAIVDTPFTNPQNLNGSLKVSVGPHLVLTIDGIPGPELDLDFSGEGDLTPLANPWWSLGGEATLSVQYHLDLFKVLSVNYAANLFDHHFDLLKANGPLFPPTATATPTSIPSNATATPVPPTATSVAVPTSTSTATAISTATAMPVPVIPGGLWVAPANGSTTSGSVRFEAEAYPTKSGDPPIDHVNFTVGWAGLATAAWPIACTEHAPLATAADGHPIYGCTVDLSTLHPQPPPGALEISFDVYDSQYVQGQSGHYNLAPNGVHMITYTRQQPPAAPTNVQATAADPTDANIAWTDTAGDAQGFRVYDGGNLLDTVGANANSDMVGNLTPGSYNCFKVEAYNSAGANASAWSCITLPQPSLHSLTVAPISGAAGSQACLTWLDGGSDQNGPATGVVQFDGQQISSFTTPGSDESWSGCVTVPASAQLGQHSFTIIDNDSSPATSAQFSVTSTAGPIAASSGPNYPTSTTQDGSGSFSIGNITGVQQVGGAIASGALNSFGITRFNILTNTGFGFSIPSNAVITGIVAEVNRHGSQNTATRFVTDSIVQLVKGGSVVGSNKADTVTPWDTSVYHTITYGSPADLWGTTWSPSDINSPSFGLDFTAQGEDQSGSTTSADIDFIRLTVYYTVG